MPLTIRQKQFLVEGLKAEVEDVALNKGQRNADGIYVEAHVRIWERFYDSLNDQQKAFLIQSVKDAGLNKKAEVKRARKALLEAQAAQLEAEAVEAENEVGS